jgi:hypothetical protein
MICYSHYSIYLLNTRVVFSGFSLFYKFLMNNYILLFRIINLSTINIFTDRPLSIGYKGERHITNGIFL